MPNHALHARIDQFLRHDGRGFRVGLVVFANQFKMHFFAADGDALGVGIVNRHARAAFVVLANQGLAARQRRGSTNAHHQFARRGSLVRGGFATTRQGQKHRGE